MKKYAMFVFNGDSMCFIHVLLNALDMHARQDTVRVIVEGSATQLVPDLDKADHPLHGLWEKVKAAGLVAGVCKACANKTGSLDAAKAQGLAPLSEMSGHPSMARFRNEGYELITF